MLPLQNMTPINELPVGTFCNLVGNIVYIINTNFVNSYLICPATEFSFVPQDKSFNAKVYKYKRVKKEWVILAKEFVEMIHKEDKLDNLTYIENLGILKNYLKPDIIKKNKD